jgi:hypothetical protein
MFPFLSEVLAVNYAVNRVVAEIRMDCLHEAMQHFGVEGPMASQEVGDRASEHSMHWSALQLLSK